MGTQSKDTVIVGGGLLGWSVAYRLAKAGQEVAVVDRADEGHATQAGAGIIAPGTSIGGPDAILPLEIGAVRYYPQLLEELVHDGEGEMDYETVGALFVARSDEEAQTLPDTLERMIERRELGMGNIGDVSLLTGQQAREFFPPLADLPGALRVEGAARVNGRHLRDALRNTSQRLGVQAVYDLATLISDPGGAYEVHAGHLVLRSSSLVIAAGAWSSKLCQPFGFELPVYPQRGQIIHLDLPDLYTGDWPIVLGYYTQYLLSFRPNRIVAGATREHDSGYEVRTTAAGIKEVLDEALAVAPGLGNATIAEIRIGLRPYSPDLLPVLGMTSRVQNVYLCTGHGASGLTLGPYSGALVAAQILGDEPEIDLAPFSPDRFQAS